MSFESAAIAATAGMIDSLGVPVTLTPLVGSASTFTAVFDRMTADQAAGVGIEGERTWCECKAEDGDAVEHGDQITHGGVTYDVVGIERDVYGMVTLLLEHAATP